MIRKRTPERISPVCPSCGTTMSFFNERDRKVWRCKNSPDCGGRPFVRVKKVDQQELEFKK